MSEADAKAMAKDVYSKAEEIRAEAVKERVAAVQAQQTDFNTGMNHLTDRVVLPIDSMIVCSVADTETLKSADEMPDADNLAEAVHGNGHELHPEGDVLDALHEDSPLPDTPDIPDVPDVPDIPDVPTPPRGARK